MGRKTKSQSEYIPENTSIEPDSTELDSLKSALRGDDPEPKRGRKSKASAEAEKNMQEAIDAICNPKILGDIVCTPFDARLAATGSKIFEVPEETRIRLGVNAATCLKAFNLITDPKWYALGLLAFELSKIAIQQELQWREYKKLIKISKEKAVDNGNKTGQ